MENFIISIITDVLASMIVAGIAWLTRKIWLDGFYSDIAKVYKSQSKALKAINKDIEISSSIKILSIRGRSVTNPNQGGYQSLWSSNNKEMEIIISSINNDIAIDSRSNATNISAEEYKLGIIYSNEILANRLTTYKNLKVFNHMENLSFKLIIMEQCVYVYYFLPEKNVHKSSVIKYKNDTGAYDAFLHYYNSLKNSKSTTKLDKSITKALSL